jgi:2-polyprenyl-3-methyl-5-hydroxy-6-metoxy-1,4-benzoquinol methylase
MSQIEEFFDNYYQEGGWKHDDFGAVAYWKRVEYLSELIKSVGRNMQILDLGCGKGEVSRYLSGENTGYIVKWIRRVLKPPGVLVLFLHATQQMHPHCGRCR